MPVIEPWSRMSVRQQSSLRPRIFPHGQNDLTPLENILILTLNYSFLYSPTLPFLVSPFLPLPLFLLLLFHLTSQTPPPTPWGKLSEHASKASTPGRGSVPERTFATSRDPAPLPEPLP